MTEYGQAFYGSDEISKALHKELGRCRSHDNGKWLRPALLKFNMPCSQYKLPKNHWFYDSDEFKRAKKPSDEIDNPLSYYSDDELQNKIKSMQAEIERRKVQDNEIIILAREICDAESFSCSDRHSHEKMCIAKAAIIAGMELQKGRET